MFLHEHTYLDTTGQGAAEIIKYLLISSHFQCQSYDNASKRYININKELVALNYLSDGSLKLLRKKK